MSFIKGTLVALVVFAFTLVGSHSYHPVLKDTPQISRATVDVFLTFTGEIGDSGDTLKVVMTGYGQGFAITPTLILTAKHVVVPPDKINLLGWDIPLHASDIKILALSRHQDSKGYYKWIEASLVWTAPDDDLALIRLKEPVPFYWNYFAKADLYDKVFFVNSLIVQEGYLVEGKVIGIGFCPLEAENKLDDLPMFKDADKKFCKDDFLVLDLDSISGDSGSAILDRYGRIVAIVSIGWKYVVCTPVYKYAKIIESHIAKDLALR